MDVDWRFRALYEQEFQAVFSTVFLLCRRRDVAEEATQEAFVRAWERWSRLRDRPWVAGWVTTTAMNLARRALRRKHPELREADPSGSDADAAIDLWRAAARRHRSIRGGPDPGHLAPDGGVRDSERPHRRRTRRGFLRLHGVRGRGGHAELRGAVGRRPPARRQPRGSDHARDPIRRSRQD